MRCSAQHCTLHTPLIYNVLHPLWQSTTSCTHAASQTLPVLPSNPLHHRPTHALTHTPIPLSPPQAAHLQQLNKMRGDCVRQIVDLKSQGKGLEVRSEAELDARIQEMEHRIQVGRV